MTVYCESCALDYQTGPDGEPNTRDPNTCDDCGGFVPGETG